VTLIRAPFFKVCVKGRDEAQEEITEEKAEKMK
jgi:hypothetical protein